jgi:hypothetical protein
MMQFEYKTVLINSKDVDDVSNSLTDKLNTYGKDGLELVSSLTQPCLGSSQYSLIGITQKFILIFKRRLEHKGEAKE